MFQQRPQLEVQEDKHRQPGGLCQGNCPSGRREKRVPGRGKLGGGSPLQGPSKKMSQRVLQVAVKGHNW